MGSFAARLAYFIKDFCMLRAYWGYYVIAALFIAEIAVTGISFYSFSLYIRAWQNDPAFAFDTAQVGFNFTANPVSLVAELVRYFRDLANGWSLTAINFSFSFGLLVSFFLPAIGSIIDRKGPKVVMLVAVPTIALSLMLRAFMTEVWHLWILQFIMLFGQSAAFLGTGMLVGLWFQTNRGLAMGITMAGNNAGGIVMAPLSAFMIGAVGWRAMFLIFGAVLFVVNFSLIALFVKDKPRDVAQYARKAQRWEEYAAVRPAMGDDLDEDEATQAAMAKRSGSPSRGAVTAGFLWKEALRTKAFWLIAIAQFASFVSIFAVLNQLGYHLDIMGMDISVAGTALGLLGFFGLLGKIIFGMASEKWPVRYDFSFCLALQVIGILLLFQVRSNGQIYLLFPFVAIYGLGFGAMGALQPLIMLETFGLVAYGTINGVMRVIVQGANAMTPPAVGVSVDTTGTYFLAFTAAIVLLAVGTLAVVMARTPRDLR